jgi:hypothetical protein
MGKIKLLGMDLDFFSAYSPLWKKIDLKNFHRGEYVGKN